VLYDAGMNTRYICIAVVLAGVLYAGVAHAQPAGGPPVDSSTSTSNAPDRRAGAEDRRSARTDAVPSHVKQRAYSLTDNIRTRMNAAVARLRNITDRMDTRAQLLAERDLDVSSALGDIATARTALTRADDILSEDLGALLYGENPRAGFFAAKTRLMTAKEQIFAARTALQSALTQLKSVAQTTDGNSSGAVSQGTTTTETNQ